MRELTADMWPALEDLFATTPEPGRCWCMYWRIGRKYVLRSRDVNKESFHEVVTAGPPPGLLAFDGDIAVGWCQVTPRDALPKLDRTRRLARVDDEPVWSISCFVVREGYRRQGVSALLIDAAVETARRAGAVAVEAYAIDAKLMRSGAYTGHRTTFERAGFATVARHVPWRPIMRLEFPRAQPDRAG